MRRYIMLRNGHPLAAELGLYTIKGGISSVPCRRSHRRRFIFRPFAEELECSASEMVEISVSSVAKLLPRPGVSGYTKFIDG